MSTRTPRTDAATSTTTGGNTPPLGVGPAVLVSGISENHIAELQNDPTSRLFLAARFDRYQRASHFVTGQFWLMVSTVLSALLKIAKPEWSLGIDSYIMAALFIELLLDYAQERFREQGAAVQEKFDRRLYGLPSSDMWIERLHHEDIETWADDGNRRANPEERDSWTNWYAPDVARLPLDLARVACQRSNAWWDSNQRSAFAYLLLGAGSFALCLVLVAAVVPNISRDAVKESVIVWLPLPYWLVREGLRHHRAAKDREAVLEYASEFVDAAIERRASDEDLERAAESIQAALFRQRRSGPLVWTWFYKRRRSTSERAMQSGIKVVVEKWERQYGNAYDI